MPAGVPVGTLAIGEAGARNAGLLAARILALSDPALAERLAAYAARARPQSVPARGRGLTALRMADFPLAPGSTIGVLGGGQLGRMLALAAARPGLRRRGARPRAAARRRTASPPTPSSAAYDDPDALAGAGRSSPT